jgi:cytochrome c553
MIRLLNAMTIVAGFVMLSGCLEQYDSAPTNKMFQGEYDQSKKVPENLSSTGELPTPAVAVPIDQKYATFCASCHGAKGGGDGPAGVALEPKPRALTDKTWQASVSDERIYNVLKNGGVSVGLAATMAPWGGVLSDGEIKEMVAFIRAL